MSFAVLLQRCTTSPRTISWAEILKTFISRRRPFSSVGSSSAPRRLPFTKSSLGLDRSFIVPYLEIICQLPEANAAWTNCRERSNLEPLDRAVQIFESMRRNGGEHVAINALKAEVQHRQGHYDEALTTLDDLENQVTKNEHLTIPHASCDILLAKAKVQWTRGNFAQSQEICDKLIAEEHDDDNAGNKSFQPSPLHLASAMTGKALSHLASMDSMDQAFSVRDHFRVALKFLERGNNPASSSLSIAAAYSNAGAAEAIYNNFVQERNDVSVPMDSALKTWFQGLQRIERSNIIISDEIMGSQLYRASKFLQASIQADLAWGVLNYEHDRNDRLNKASEYAKKALEAFGPESTTDQDGLRRVLAIVASCYHQAGSAVTAEGLYQSAVSRKTPPNGPLQQLELHDALLGYSKLLSKWDKRQRDAERMEEEALQVHEELPETWRGKSVVHSSLWFWTPADFQ